jgi:hypothetical protein
MRIPLSPQQCPDLYERIDEAANSTSVIILPPTQLKFVSDFN